MSNTLKSLSHNSERDTAHRDDEFNAKNYVFLRNSGIESQEIDNDKPATDMTAFSVER